ncbi:hypothetical protein ACFQ8A_39285, partial [Streptomyces erythrochromogenes]
TDSGHSGHPGHPAPGTVAAPAAAGGRPGRPAPGGVSDLTAAIRDRTPTRRPALRPLPAGHPPKKPAETHKSR